MGTSTSVLSASQVLREVVARAGASACFPLHGLEIAPFWTHKPTAPASSRASAVLRLQRTGLELKAQNFPNEKSISNKFGRKGTRRPSCSSPRDRTGVRYGACRRGRMLDGTRGE